MPTYPRCERSMINIISVAVYQSTETQSSIIYTNTFSINIQKNHTHNSLMTFIGCKQSFAPLKIMAVFFPSLSPSPKHTFSYFLPRVRKFTLFKSTAREFFNTDKTSPVKKPLHFLDFYGLT